MSKLWQEHYDHNLQVLCTILCPEENGMWNLSQKVTLFFFTTGKVGRSNNIWKRGIFDEISSTFTTRVIEAFRKTDISLTVTRNDFSK